MALLIQVLLDLLMEKSQCKFYTEIILITADNSNANLRTADNSNANLRTADNSNANFSYC